MSGSPVFVKAHGNFGKEGSPMGNSRFFGFWTQLIGIYSGRNGNETDGFQLARVWNAGLVDEMLNDPRKPELPFKQK